MKKIDIIACAIFVFIVLGIVMISNKNGKGTEDDKYLKVGVVMDGSISDKGWNQAHYDGLQKTVSALEIDIIYKENVTDYKCMDVIEELIDSGCGVIICTSYEFGEFILKAADIYKDVYFFQASGRETRGNVSNYFGRIYQMRYLSGIVAGMQTETNEIGYVASLPVSEVTRGINAFALGVSSVNPDAKVYVKWADSWEDDKKIEKAARELLAQKDIDVITSHTDTLKVMEIAEEKEIWSIGYNYDCSSDFPNTNLTSAVWDWDVFYKSRIMRCINGKFEAESYWGGYEEGLVSLTELSSCAKQGIEYEVDNIKKKLKSGTFDVFYGPIKDNEGTLRIEEGENISDQILLLDFDWYAEGVEVVED